MAKLTITIEAKPCNCGGAKHHKPKVNVAAAYDAEGQECGGLLRFQALCPELIQETVGKLIALDVLVNTLTGSLHSTAPEEAASVEWPSELHSIS